MNAGPILEGGEAKIMAEPQRPRKPRKIWILSRYQFSLLAWIWFLVMLGMIVAAIACSFYFVFVDKGVNDTGWGGAYGRMALSILGLLIVMIWLSLKLTHRVAGPIYRIMRRLEEMAEGNLHETMRLRQKDQFQDLAQQLNLTIESLRLEREQTQQQASLLQEQLRELEQRVNTDEPRMQASIQGDSQKILSRAKEICSQLTGSIS